MYDDNIHVYIFAGAILGRGRDEYLRKAGVSGTKEREEFLNTVLLGEEKKLTHKQISLLTPESWLSGNSINPIIAYSSDICASLIKLAKDYLLNNEIVEDRETLDALGNSVTIDNWSNIAHITYFVNMTAKTVIRKI